jgi:hypothetical protein
MAAIHGYIALIVTGGIPAGTGEQEPKNTLRSLRMAGAIVRRAGQPSHPL